MSRRILYILFICTANLRPGNGYLRNFKPADHASARSGGVLHSHIFKESIPSLYSRTDLVDRSPLRGDHSHELVFVIRQNNMDLLEQTLNEISDPSSPTYGQHLSAEQISAITLNPEARDAIVDYLHVNGATISAEGRSGDSINAVAPISVWEKILDTTFYSFHQEQHGGNIERFVRTEKYSIPRELDLHLASVLRTVDIPLVRPGSVITPHDEAKIRITSHTGRAIYDGVTRPQLLRKYYDIGDAKGSTESTQAAVGFGSNYFSQRSLAYHQKNMSLEALQPALSFGGFISENPALDYLEPNLDMEFIMAISPGSPTTYWHVAHGFETMMTELVNSNNPPLVISISYGADESSYPANSHDFVTVMAIKLCAMGRTLVAASGDDGVHSWKVAQNMASCGYDPNFPGSNPYFTSIGATSVSPSMHIPSEVTHMILIILLQIAF